MERRADHALPFLRAGATAGGGLLLDTCMYIDQIQGRAPPDIEDLLGLRIVNHSMVAVQEMMHAIGALDPRDPRTGQAVAAMVEGMPPHRLFTPDADVLGIAAVYAGILSLTQSYARDDRRRALHDCTLFLHALKLGLTVLTRNVRDFDLLLQMRPDGRALFYRA